MARFISYNGRTPSAMGAAVPQQFLLFEFGPFTLRMRDAALLRAGQVVPLRFKAFETLRVLVEQHGRIVGRDELLERVWPGQYVEENSISQNISIIRRLLDPSFPDQRPIETLSKKGYRLAIPVRIRAGEDDLALRVREAPQRQQLKSLIGQILVFSPSQVADAILAAGGRTKLTATLLPTPPGNRSSLASKKQDASPVAAPTPK